MVSDYSVTPWEKDGAGAAPEAFAGIGVTVTVGGSGGGGGGGGGGKGGSETSTLCAPTDRGTTEVVCCVSVDSGTGPCRQESAKK